VAAVQSVLGMADAGAREVLHAHSPSETGASLGADWIAGIVLGIQSATDSVTQAVLGQIALLVGYFQTLPVMISAALLNHDWTGVGTAIVDAIKNGWSIEFGALADVFINNMLSLQKKFRENTQWKLIGQLIIHGIAAGVLAAAQELATAAANVVSAAIAAARKAAGIHSPSTEGIDLGANFVSGVVIGIQQSTAGAVKVMSNAMSAIMAPALAMPAITQQYAVSAPASVNNTNSYTNNWNLNIHSQARTEQVIQDYNMMRALAGA
jgi:F0F1-type ATP synthase assembly protein I